MIPERQRPTNERAFRPLRDKTLRAMIRQRFIQQYGYADAVPIAEFITNDLLELIEQVGQSGHYLHPGQMVWLGVPVELPREYHGKRLGDLPLKPIVLSVLTEQDVQLLQAAKTTTDWLDLRCQRVSRLFQEAYAQGVTLPYADVAALCSLSLSVLEKDVERAEAAMGTPLPHRGRIHAIGPTTTHKAQIVESLLQGKQIPEVARLHQHSIHNVDRYYRGYNAVEIAAGFTDDLNLIALMTGIAYHVAVQYYALVEKYHPEKIISRALVTSPPSGSQDAGHLP